MASQDSSLLHVSVDLPDSESALEHGAVPGADAQGGSKRKLGVALALCASVGMLATARQSVIPSMHTGLVKTNSSVAVMGKSEGFVSCDYQHTFPCMGPMRFTQDGGESFNAWAINAGGANAAVSISDCNALNVPLTGRAYLGTDCLNYYTPAMYANWAIVGHHIAFNVYLAQAGPGCVAAMYLTPMAHMGDAGSCNDYYCDSSSVCGLSCGEVDLMEANVNAFRSTGHILGDSTGVAIGVGGGKGDWDASIYGAGAGHVIDSTQMFHVGVSFRGGDLMEMALSQGDRVSPVLSVTYPGLDMQMLGGATPVFSYWSSGDTAWFDGAQTTGQCGGSIQISELYNTKLA